MVPRRVFQPPPVVAVFTTALIALVELLKATTYSRFSKSSFLETTNKESLAIRSCITPFARPGFAPRNAAKTFRYLAMGCVSVTAKESPLPIGFDPTRGSVFQIPTLVENMSWRAN